ncbi:MAG TPA: hypothetical protein VFW07_23495 [Parafilimonas sp.]|nr:hypothetical protein [Parafilimonas sp.]
MKAITSFKYSHWEDISKYAKREKQLIIKRITPFFLLSLFLSFWSLYAIVAGTGATITTKLILYPFLLINFVFADFAIWNYLAGKKLWLLWVLESVVSTMLVCWLL